MKESIAFFSPTNYLDIAAAITSLVLMILYLYRRVFFTKQGNIFLAMTISNIVMALGAMSFRTMLTKNNLPAAVRYILFIVDSSLAVCYIVFYYFYVYDISKEGKGGKKSIWAWVVPSVGTLVLLVIFTTPFTKWFVNLDKAGKVVNGPLSFLISIQALITIFFIILMNITASRVLSKNQSVVLWAIIGLIGFLLAAKAKYGTTTMDTFINSLITMILFAAMENPSFYLYENGFTYNDNAFYELTSGFVKGKKKWVVFTALEEKEHLQRLMPKEDISSIINGFAKEAHQNFPHDMLFYLEDTTFALYTDDDPEEVAGKFLDAYFIASHKDDDSVALNPYAAYLSFEDVNNADTLRKARDVFASRKKSSNSMVRVSRITSMELDRRRRELAVIKAVKNAIEKNTIQVFYQPIVFARSGRTEAAEALIRIRDADLGNISPKEFLPLAEENGLIVPLGETVFRKVCEFIKTSDVRRLGVSFIEINMSVIQCMQYDMADRIVNILTEYDVEPGMINLEINDTTYKTDKELMLRNVNKLRNFGLGFSLEDFGAGFSNAEYITTIPVTFVNIAIELVTAAMEDRNSLLILKNYVNLIKDLRYGCIAKGVESGEMVESMKDIGCDAFQGYYYARAMNEDDFIRYILKRD